MKRKDWIVTEKSARPFGKPDRCFYCGRLIGEQHKEDCVIRSKTVVVDFTFRAVLVVPEFWDENQINFRYNESTWCADNILNKLQSRSGEVGCSCDICTAKYVGDATERDEEKYRITNVEELDS